MSNIVATCSLNCPLRLKDIALHARNAEYNPRRFAAIIMRLREPKATALVFSSGKIVCTGAQNEELARTASRKIARIIQKLGNPVVFNNFKIHNVVGSVSLNFPIDLDRVMEIQPKFCVYEPESFPGLAYKLAEPRVVIMMFTSGKMVFTGAKTRGDIHLAYQKVYPLVESCRRRKIDD